MIRLYENTQNVQFLYIYWNKVENRSAILSTVDWL